MLGSRSPRRIRLLEELGIPFEQMVPSVEEDRLPGEPAYEFALRLARDKAFQIDRQVGADRVVIGSDTIVVLNDRILQKPSGSDEAYGILMTLAGRMHVVCTALALSRDSELVAGGYELTRVFFNPVAPQQVRQYIDTGEPMDKAGAYGIQGMGAFLVDRIEGNLDNVIGLPRTLLDNLAREVIAKRHR